MTIMAQHYGQPQHAPVSPNMYPQGSAVNFLGALAQQYHQGQQFNPEQFQHQMTPEQFHQQQQMMQMQFPPHVMMNPQLQHQYHQQMLMHQMQNQHHQQMMQHQQQQPQNLAPQRDNEGYQYSIQHQQREMMHRQRQAPQQQPQSQQGLLSPVPTQGLLSPRIASTPNTQQQQTRASPKSIERKSPAQPVMDTQPKKPVQVQTPVVPKKVKPRTNFHSIADLVGDSSSKSPEPEPETTLQESSPKVRESLTEFIQRGKRRRTSDLLNSSLDSEPGNLIIDEQRCNEFYPAAERQNQTTCPQPMRDAKTPSRDYIPPMGEQHSTPAPVSRETSPGSDSRAVSPALSTISSIRDTDTPCSVASADSFTCLTKDDEKPPTTKKARSSDDDGGKRSSKSRRIFQAPQIHILEQVFAQCQYPEPAFVEKLARDLDTTDGKVRVWFQNKRARWRKRSHDNDQSKQSPWLPGTPLYGQGQPQGQGQGQLSPVSMQAQQAAMQNGMPAGAMNQGSFTAMLQQGMTPQMHPQFAFMGMQ